MHSFFNVLSLVGKTLLLTCMIILTACENETAVGSQSQSSPADLAEHSEEFTRTIEKVTEGVYVAIGFGLANSIMLEGNDGLVIVDTMETIEEGEEVLKAFRQISDKPIKG